MNHLKSYLGIKLFHITVFLTAGDKCYRNRVRVSLCDHLIESCLPGQPVTLLKKFGEVTDGVNYAPFSPIKDSGHITKSKNLAGANSGTCC